jgi:hypothetical protein
LWKVRAGPLEEHPDIYFSARIMEHPAAIAKDLQPLLIIGK